jgi:uncharacterized protein (DUF1778 family)
MQTESKLEKTVGVRVTTELYNMLGEVCRARGEDMADFIRRAVLKELASLSFLPAVQKKALGIKTEVTSQ